MMGRIWLLAITSTMLSGNILSINSLATKGFGSVLTEVDISNTMCFPGSNQLAITSPNVSATSVANVNQTMVFNPILPIDFESPAFAIPTNSNENTSGAMIILINRRKISLSNSMLSANGLMFTGSG